MFCLNQRKLRSKGRYFITKIVFGDFDFCFNFVIKFTTAFDHLLQLIRKPAISPEFLTMADTNFNVHVLIQG